MGTPAGKYRPAVEEHRWQVEPRGGHEHPWQGLVATGERGQSVEALGVHHRLDRVGDDLPAHQRGAHPLCAHRNPVGHGDRDELDGVPTGVPHASFGTLGEPVEREVARSDLVP